MSDLLEELDALLAEPRLLAGAFIGLFVKVFGAVKVAADREDARRRAASATTEAVQASSSAAATTASARDEQVIAALLSLLGDIVAFVPSTVLPTTYSVPSITQEATNDDAVVTVIQCGGIAGVCDALPTLTFPNAEKAAEVRDAIVTAVDAVAERVSDDALFQELQDAKAAAVEHLDDVAGSLPILSSFTPATTQPALVLAYELYEDALRDEELVRRNSIRHPGFVPGAEPLEVLSNG